VLPTAVTREAKPGVLAPLIAQLFGLSVSVLQLLDAAIHRQQDFDY
jgi:hypothetical protein